MAFEDWAGMFVFMFFVLMVLALAFVIVQFIDMLKSKKIKRETKLVLIILFVLASLLTAIVYYIWKKV